MVAPVVAAVITAAVAVLVAVVTQASTAWRARSDRTYERRRSALLDVQDAALDVRHELQAYGTDLVPRADDSTPQPLPGPAAATLALELPDPPPSARVDRAQGLLEVRAVRLDERCAEVSAALAAWREAAQDHFLSPRDESLGAERDAWAAFNHAVGAVLNA